MCGIAGCFRFDRLPVGARGIEAMLGMLDHRGPDASGLWCGPGVGLGHRRLSIIDPTGSPQPMASSDERFHLTFNGEILNYAALRPALAGSFRTAGDTEVLLRVIETLGTAGLDRLRGQFAFAAHDHLTDTLLMGRDRLGILPLYYVVDGDRLLFASEVKALLAALPHRRVDIDSLHDYLGHRAVHAPYTLFEGIRKVPPGHWLRVDRSGHVDIQPYWSLSAEPDDVLDVDPRQAVELVDAALQDSMTEALVADVPVGAYLSGGLDSSLVVALAARLRGQEPVSTYSAGFEGSSADERPWARAVSRLLGTDHHELVVGSDDFIASWAPLTWHRDAPLSEPADVARFRLAEAASADVKVVLSGEGSDELFAGYPKYLAATASELVATIPSAVRTPVLLALERQMPRRLGRSAIALRAMAGARQGDRLRTWFAPFTADERVALLGPSTRPSAPWYDDARGDAVRRMLYSDCHGWLSDNLLESSDRMSMAASVELRPPFLDARLVDLAFRLPSSVKLRGRNTKWVVKQVARRYLPAQIVDRKKVGFRVPLDAWFRGGLRDLAWDMLTSESSFVGEIMSPVAVRQLLVSHDHGRRDEHIRLWTLLGLEVWHEVFFRSHLIPARPPAASAAPP